MEHKHTELLGADHDRDLGNARAVERDDRGSILRASMRAFVLRRIALDRFARGLELASDLPGSDVFCGHDATVRPASGASK